MNFQEGREEVDTRLDLAQTLDPGREALLQCLMGSCLAARSFSPAWLQLTGMLGSELRSSQEECPADR